MLSGEAADAATLDKAVTIARQFGPEIINTVSVMSPQQVMLEVRFIEISRTAGRELGVQWNIFGGNSTINIGSRQPAGNLPITVRRATNIPAAKWPPACCPAPRRSASRIARMVAGGATIDVLINALEQKGVARSLAEPNLVALSGDTASFLAGGEYPIPVAGTLRAGHRRLQEIRRRPRLYADRARRRPDQPEDRAGSEPDRHHPSGDGEHGVSVPALIVRRASTTIELRDGQSFMIGGLLQTDNKNQIEQLPWLGSVPVLGALFSSKSYQTEPDRPRHHRDAASGASDAAGRRRQDAGR